MKTGSAVLLPGNETNDTELDNDLPRDPDTSLGKRVVAVAAGAVLLVAYVLHAALPASPFGLPGPDSKSIRTFMPQGWAFFTKSPRTETPTVYRYSPDGRWHDITAGPLAEPGHVMGFDRTARAQGTELAILIHAAPRDAWRDCDLTPTDCLSATTVSGVITNRSNQHSACGEIGLVVQQVLPWAWRDAPTVMPSKVLRVRVTC